MLCDCTLFVAATVLICSRPSRRWLPPSRYPPDSRLQCYPDVVLAVIHGCGWQRPLVCVLVLVAFAGGNHTKIIPSVTERSSCCSDETFMAEVSTMFEITRNFPGLRSTEIYELDDAVNAWRRLERATNFLCVFVWFSCWVNSLFFD